MNLATVDLSKRFLSVFCFCLLLFSAGTKGKAAEDAATGQDIYKQQCADCHGAKGEGVEELYAEPLQGERPLQDLTKLINDTMPEGEPESCLGEDAERVASFIFDTFYTPEARARNRPPRIAVSRLTVRQYLNAAADLVATFVGESQAGDQRGLKGQYYDGRSYRSDKRKLEQIDTRIDFDFGEKSPLPEEIAAEEFSMQWQGGVIAAETGDYEFCVKTENGFRLFVNDHQTPLIDGWVKSGTDTEHAATIRLLGGRVYPIRLEYFKFKDKTASVSLQWQPPHRVREVIPTRNLSPDWFPSVMVVTTEFPADDSSVGYERGTSVSEAWDQATTHAAIEIVSRIVTNLDTVAKTKPDAADHRDRLQDFCHRFAERAFRRPLTDEQQNFFIAERFAGEDDAVTAVKRSLLLVLKSPRFLYLGLQGDELDDYEVASRLSFGLWDSLPDQNLLTAASQGRLLSAAEVERQANRMVGNPRAKAKLRYFLHQWLQVERGYDLSKDQEQFGDFDKALLADMLTSLDLFVEDVLWQGNSDFRQLLLADELYVNERLAAFYGLEMPAGENFQQIALDAEKHAGVLTHPYLMTAFAYHKASSPIHRGVFLIRGVLGRALKPPPIAVAPADEGMDPNLTTRERVAKQTSDDVCMSCHSMINPLGFSLENYNAVGQFRSQENGNSIDASGMYKPLEGESVEFTGARQLADFLANSRETHAAFATQLFHNLVKQPVTAYAPDQVDQLVNRFAQDDYSVRGLMVEIMKTSALKTND